MSSSTRILCHRTLDRRSSGRLLKLASDVVQCYGIFKSRNNFRSCFRRCTDDDMFLSFGTDQFISHQTLFISNHRIERYNGMIMLILMLVLTPAVVNSRTLHRITNSSVHLNSIRNLTHLHTDQLWKHCSVIVWQDCTDRIQSLRCRQHKMQVPTRHPCNVAIRKYLSSCSG